MKQNIVDVVKIRQDFPLLGKEGVYFDNACQSLRPQFVIDAMNEYYNEYPACGGRSMHHLATKVTHKCDEARDAVANFLHAKRKEEIVFTRNTTEGINLVAHSLGLKEGDIVITSDKEHNSNLIPWQVLKEKLGIEHKIIFSKEDFTIASKQSLEAAAEDVKKHGGKPYIIPVGASDHPLGGLGYVRFAEEVRQQERELGIHLDYIVVASASGSTQAGMVVGFAEDGRANRVIGIDVTANPEATRAQIMRIAQNTAKLVGLNRAIIDTDIVLNEDYAYPEYGIPSAETIAAIQLCSRMESMITDPVYEGKSMQALIDMIQNNRFQNGSKILLCAPWRRTGD